MCGTSSVWLVISAEQIPMQAFYESGSKQCRAECQHERFPDVCALHYAGERETGKSRGERQGHTHIAYRVKENFSCELESFYFA